MKMGVIPATNKAFSAKLEKTKITVKENKITSWAVEPTQGAGLNAILDQLGVKLPTLVICFEICSCLESQPRLTAGFCLFLPATQNASAVLI